MLPCRLQRPLCPIVNMTTGDTKVDVYWRREFSGQLVWLPWGYFSCKSPKWRSQPVPNFAQLKLLMEPEHGVGSFRKELRTWKSFTQLHLCHGWTLLVSLGVFQNVRCQRILMESQLDLGILDDLPYKIVVDLDTLLLINLFIKAWSFPLDQRFLIP